LKDVTGERCNGDNERRDNLRSAGRRGEEPLKKAMREESARRERAGSCPACGFHNGEWETRCEKCGRRLSALRGSSRSAAGTLSAHSPQSEDLARREDAGSDSGPGRPKPKLAPRPPAFPEHLRKHLQDRVHRFRVRQENPTLALPFEEELAPPSKIISFPAPAPIMELPIGEEEIRVPRHRPVRESPPHAPVSSPQPGLDFQPATLQEQVWRLRPVAPFRIRLRGHLRDLTLIGGALAIFLLGLSLTRFLGVVVVPKLILFGGIVCGSALLTLLYGLLFLWGAGATPGMRATGLRLVNFDGLPASRQQRLWRLLGGIVSGGSFLIGFLWAVVDEEKLYWHDHISKTYLTLADP
jgi:uncharacterized RDD family membrane protein YckC